MEVVRICDVFTVARGGSPRPIQDFLTDGEGINWIMIGDTIENEKYINHTKKKIKVEGLKKSRKVYPGDFLLTNSMSFGKPFILNIEGCIHDGWLVLSPKIDEIDNTYMYYCLSSNQLKKQISLKAAGAVVKNLNSEIVRDIQIPLPPLATQKAIAEKLDKADALRKKDQELLKQYDELAQSIFIEMFGDPVQNEKGWETKFIQDLVSKDKNSLKRGPFGGALKKEIFVEKGYLVYEQYHALNNDFTMERYFIDDKKFKELESFSVKPKDIIISCSGVYLGKLAIIPDNAKEGIINQALLKLTLNESVMTNDFFVFHFSQPNFKTKYFDSNRGAGIPNFPPMSEFKQFPFITPPLALQNQFAEKIKNIEAQKELVKKQAEASENLFQALLQESFSFT